MYANLSHFSILNRNPYPIFHTKKLPNFDLFGILLSVLQYPCGYLIHFNFGHMLHSVDKTEVQPGSEVLFHGLRLQNRTKQPVTVEVALQGSEVLRRTVNGRPVTDDFEPQEVAPRIWQRVLSNGTVVIDESEDPSGRIEACVVCEASLAPSRRSEEEGEHVEYMGGWAHAKCVGPSLLKS